MDWLLLAGFIAFSVCLAGGLIVSPRGAYFAVGDAAYSFPHVPDDTVAVTLRALTAYVIVVPCGTIILVDGMLRRTTAERMTRRLQYALLGLALALLLCATAQLASGALTPDWLARCVLAAGASGVLRSDAAGVCTSTDDAAVTAGRMSFPSTTATLTAYSMIITALYVRNHVWFSSSRFLPVLLQVLPLAGGVWATLAAYSDARAHGVDILAGLGLGTGVAAWTQWALLGGLKRSYKGEDATEVIEFLRHHGKPADDPEVAALFLEAARAQAQAAAAAAAHTEGSSSSGAGAGVGVDVGPGSVDIGLAESEEAGAPVVPVAAPALAAAPQYRQQYSSGTATPAQDVGSRGGYRGAPASYPSSAAAIAAAVGGLPTLSASGRGMGAAYGAGVGPAAASVGASTSGSPASSIGVPMSAAASAVTVAGRGAQPEYARPAVPAPHSAGASGFGTYDQFALAGYGSPVMRR